MCPVMPSEAHPRKPMGEDEKTCCWSPEGVMDERRVRKVRNQEKPRGPRPPACAAQPSPGARSSQVHKTAHAV